jgi:hypothetical protein
VRTLVFAESRILFIFCPSSRFFLTSQQKQYEDGTVELVTKLSASEAPAAGREGTVDAEAPLHPVVTREWRDQIHTV